MSADVPSVLGLHHVALPFPGTAEAVSAARLFYGSLLGLKELEIPVSMLGVLWFDAGAGTEIHLYTNPEESGLRSPRHPCLRVRDLASVRDQLRAAGVEMIEPEGDIPDRRRLFAFDPFGNAVELAEFG